MPELVITMVYVSFIHYQLALQAYQHNISKDRMRGKKGSPCTIGLCVTERVMQSFFKLNLNTLMKICIEHNIRISVILSSKSSFLFARSEEHTSELQSRETISYAVFCLKKKKKKTMEPQIGREHV